MKAIARHQSILDKLQGTGAVDVAELAVELQATPITIRRDLDQLAAAGVLRRVRGGAISLMIRGEALPFAVREVEAADAKVRMAVIVASLIADGEAVVVASGTTGTAVARQLASRRVTVMPMSVQAIAALAGSDSVELLLPGGNVRHGEGAVVGPLAESTLRGLRFDTAVVSCSGLSPDDGVTEHDPLDAAVKQAMVASAKRTIVVAEGAKFARTGLAVVCASSSVSVLVTDESAPEDDVEAFRMSGVQVVRA